MSDSAFSPHGRAATRDDVLLWLHDRLGYDVGVWVRVGHDGSYVCSSGGILRHFSEGSETAILARPDATRERIAGSYSVVDEHENECMSLDLNWLPNDGSSVATIAVDDEGFGELFVPITATTAWLNVRAPEPTA